MAIVTQKGIIDLIPEYNRQLRPVFCVSEGDDDSRVINLSITSGGEAFPIPSGAMVYIAGKKQDNNIFTYRCSYTSNTVVFPITAQMSADDGIVLCELQVIVNGDPLGSANFVYWVEPSPIQNGTTSESDLNLFEEAIAKFENFDHFYADVEAMVTEAVANMQIREGQTVIDASLSVSGAAADAKATGDIVRSFMNALITETTEESTIATCDDAAGGLPLKRLVANIEPAQAGSGDPSPDNVRAITGYTGVTVTRTGRNLIDDSKRVANSSLTAITLGQTAGYGTPTIFVKAGTYTFSVVFKDGARGAGYVKVGSASPVRIWQIGGTNGIFTIESDSLCSLYVYNGDTPFDSINAVVNAQVELGTTATEYEAPQIATYPVTFPTAAGTVYGGTLNVYDDGSGTLTVDRGCFTSEEFASHAKGGTTTFDEFFFRTRSTQTPAVTSLANTDMICSHAVRGSVTGVDYTQCRMGSGQPRIIFPVGTMPNLTAFNAWLAEQVEAGTPLQFSYILATPTTYALSALQVAQMLQGVNNVWTDAAGTLTAEYYASTGLYVEKKVNAQRNMIAGVEEAMIATKNYAVGDLLIVGNTLYKVTAAISSGAALVVGTNVAETTVAEQLLALA